MLGICSITTFLYHHYLPPWNQSYCTHQVGEDRSGYNRLTNSILKSDNLSFCLSNSGGSESSMCVRAYETGAC